MGKVKVLCICGKELEAWHYDSKEGYNQKSCSDACRQRAYRSTEHGRELTALYNRRYKKPEKEYTCWVCNKVFMSTRKRALCDEHSTPYYRNRKLKATRLDIVAGIRCNDRMHKKMKRGTMVKPVCVKCGKDSDVIHFHHEDYTKPEEVIPLCPDCHYKEKE